MRAVHSLDYRIPVSSAHAFPQVLLQISAGLQLTHSNIPSETAHHIQPIAHRKVSFETNPPSRTCATPAQRRKKAHSKVSVGETSAAETTEASHVLKILAQQKT